VEREKGIARKYRFLFAGESIGSKMRPDVVNQKVSTELLVYALIFKLVPIEKKCCASFLKSTSIATVLL